jgi:hypothetical protein
MSSTKDLLSITEGILNSAKPKSTAVPNESVASDGIRDVQVRESYMEQILSFASPLNEASKKVQKVDEVAILKERRESLIERLKGLLKEARDLLAEETTVGCVGTGKQTKLTRKMLRRGRK